MTIRLDQKQQLASDWFAQLRDQICAEFEKIEQEKNSTAKFECKPWDRQGGGGGVISVMKGEVFEKVGVNISTVHGEFSPEFAKQIPGTDKNPQFWASGISLVAHMKNPLIPAVHMNTRMIVTEKLWFGGGMDLTPCFENDNDTLVFHNELKQTCDQFDTSYYPRFKEECDQYFYLPHRNESRGIGGIFYDYLNTNDWQTDFSFTQAVGKAFLSVYPKIVRANYNKAWSQGQKRAQLLKRGRYVEFNLLYDRGTKFGLMTGGNIDAILMSLPPEVCWA
jgi:coproporphyrinogen III oxidase